MNGTWERGCEKEGVMMVEARDPNNHEEAKRMKVGGHNIMNYLAFQRMVKSTFFGKWRQDLKVVVVVVAQGEEFMSMVNGRRLVEVKQRYLYLQE